MHEFETFVYLEMEKTGSTFIASFLRNNTAERLVQAEKHAGMKAGCDRSKFYFTSVRDPLDAYISLYSFGCRGRGRFRTVLFQMGQGALYDGTLKGFSLWLHYVLDPANAAAFGDGYESGGEIAGLVGLQSHRFLRLVIPDAERVLLDCGSKDDIRRAYARERLIGEVVRHEHLIADLAGLLRGKLAHAFEDSEAAAQSLQSARRRNPSRRVDADDADFTPAPDLIARLREREWFLYETFGY
jgi:hypothetical protein